MARNMIAAASRTSLDLADMEGGRIILFRVGPKFVRAESEHGHGAKQKRDPGQIMPVQRLGKTAQGNG